MQIVTAQQNKFADSFSWHSYEAIDFFCLWKGKSEGKKKKNRKHNKSFSQLEPVLAALQLHCWCCCGHCFSLAKYGKQRIFRSELSLLSWLWISFFFLLERWDFPILEIKKPNLRRFPLKSDHYKCSAFCVPLDGEWRVVLNSELSQNFWL